MELKKLICPKARLIFLTVNTLNHAFPIVHVKDNIIFFSCHKELTDSFETGFFSAGDNAGIVLFKNFNIITLKNITKDEDNFYLYGIDFSKTDYSITNRRLSTRYEFKEFLPINFQVYGEMMTAQLINISEGGLRLRVNAPLKQNILCHFKIKLPTNNHVLNFETDGVVVYTEKEAKHNNYMTGISFVAPEFKSEDDKKAYLETKAGIKEFVEAKV